jgi:Tol biopolymer transport system component
VLAMAATACGSDEDAVTPTSTTTTPAPSTTTTAEPPPAPTSLVGGREAEDTTVLVDLAAGTVEPIGPGGADIRPEYAGPVNGTVYVARSLHPVQIDAIPLDGGAATTVAENGSSPTVTSDGRLLAYTHGGAPTNETVIFIRDLATGAVRELRGADPEADLVGATRLSFSADGSRLAFVWSRSVGEQHSTEIRVLDVERATSLDDAVAFGPDDPELAWTHPTFRGRFDTLAVVERSRSEADLTSTVLSVDPATGDVLAALFTVDFPVPSLDADASGFHLLFTVEEELGGPTTEFENVVYRWSGGEPELVARNLYGAVWE